MTIGAPTHCKNCHAPLSGRFCVNCGQAANVHVPTTLELIHELLEGLTHSDSRLWRTLKSLWLSPGKLTEEFIAGRRVAYLPPFRLYLIASVLFFLLASLSQPKAVVGQFDSSTHAISPITNCDDVNLNRFAASHPAWNQRIRHTCQAIMSDNGESMMRTAISTMSKAMFIFLPLIALLNMLMYWRPRHRYAEHLLFFVHLHAMFFSVAVVMILLAGAGEFWPKLQGPSDILATLLGWSLPIYSVLALRRVFRRRWFGTLLKAAGLYVVYLAVFGLTAAGVVVYAALQL
jgi:Protein of unknown function (DUF3667)